MEDYTRNFNVVLSVIQQRSSYDFSNYRRPSLWRRYVKIAENEGMTSKEIIYKLETSDEYLEYVVKEMTITTTELFRDPETWLMIRNNVIPAISNNDSIRIWHAGCSNGLEVYSMLILLNEVNRLEGSLVYGTDLNRDVLDEAEMGHYGYRFSASYIENFNKVFARDILEKGDPKCEHYFLVDPNRDIIKIRPFLTRKALFLQHDLADTQEFFSGSFDLILCRNVLIYFNHILQKKGHSNLYERF